jgi:hypothetical protein
MRITTWAEYGVICALRLARRIDETLVGVLLSDLLEAEPKVRRRVGLPVLLH